ncbi:unnamed protein product, partial [Sphacelaria rigidula]
YFFTLLNAISATIDQTVIDQIAQRPIALRLGDLPSTSEPDEDLRAMWNGKATGPHSLPAEPLEVGLNGEAPEIMYHFHSIVSAVWISGEVPQEWKDVTIKVLHKEIKDRVATPSVGISLVAHAAKALLKIVANRLGNFCEETDVFPEEQYGFRRQRSTTDMMFVVHRLQELGWASSVPLNTCFIDPQNACDSIDSTLLWEVLAGFEVPPRMITIIRMFHDGMRARVQLDGGELSACFHVYQGLRQSCVSSPVLFNIFGAAL